MRNNETRDVWPAMRSALQAQMPWALAYRVETHATAPGFPDVVVQMPRSGRDDRIAPEARTLFVELKTGRWKTTDFCLHENPPSGGRRWFPVHHVERRRPPGGSAVEHVGRRQVWATLSERRPAQAAWDRLHRAAGGHSLVLARCAPTQNDLHARGWLWVALATGTDATLGPQVYAVSVGPAPDLRELLDVPRRSALDVGMLRDMAGVFAGVAGLKASRR